MDLDTYYICLLRKGPTWTAEDTPELERLQESHLAHTLRLWHSGATIASGPIADTSDLRGFSIFRTATLEEARALAEDDPGVRAGRFVIELHEWKTPAGSLPKPSARGE